MPEVEITSMSELYTLNKIHRDSIFVFVSPRFEAGREIEKELSSLEKLHPLMLIAKIHPEIYTVLAQSYQILVWPTFIRLHNGREVKRVVGGNMKEVQELFKGGHNKVEDRPGSASTIAGLGL